MTINTRQDGLSIAQAIGKALSDQGRLRILAALRARELCVCHLCALLGLDQSTVSRHMATLRDGGLVAGRRAGRWTIYRRTDDLVSEPIRSLLAAVDAIVSGSRETGDDTKKLDRIVAANAVSVPAGER